MVPNQENNKVEGGETRMPPANTGNASNPSPPDEKDIPAGTNQLLNEKAEKYLREVASIEDLPDAQDEQDMNDTIDKENEKKE